MWYPNEKIDIEFLPNSPRLPQYFSEDILGSIDELFSNNCFVQLNKGQVQFSAKSSIGFSSYAILNFLPPFFVKHGYKA